MAAQSILDCWDSMFQEDGTEAVMQALPNTDGQAHEQMQAVLTALKMVPNFVRLGNFPDHCSGPVCWCRPRVVFGIQGFAIFHKDLVNGEFDC